MQIEASDLVDWISDRHAALVDAWASEPAFAIFDSDLVNHVVEVLHTSMLEVMVGNGDERDFMTRVSRNTSVTVEGTLGLRFFQVTLKLARAAARSSREKRTAAVFPYRRASVVGDSRTHQGHLALSDIVLPRDHSFWRRWHPPLEMDCRCSAIVMTRGQFERSGLDITDPTALAEKEARLMGSWPKAFEPLLDFRR